MFNVTQVKNVFRYAVTIPANTGNGSALRELLRTAGFQGEASAIFIDGLIPGVAGTARAAIMAANPRQGAAIADTDFTTHGQYIAAGRDYYQPVDADWTDTYFRTITSSTLTALVTVYL